MSENPYQSPKGIEQPPPDPASRRRLWRLVASGAFGGFFFGVTVGVIDMVVVFLLLSFAIAGQFYSDPFYMAGSLIADVTVTAFIGAFGGGLAGIASGAFAGIVASILKEQHRFRFNVLTVLACGAGGWITGFILGIQVSLDAAAFAASVFTPTGIYGGTLLGRYISNVAWGRRKKRKPPREETSISP